ncbi:MAG: hypothetical protein VB024_01700 [Dysgonamonadaceae bacterium]|nr:hypothetical protein [Dysgonamonadaceae bacterium]
MNYFFGTLSDEDCVKKRSCPSEASSSLLVIKTLAGQGNCNRVGTILHSKSLSRDFSIVYKYLALFFEDINYFFGHLSDEDYVQKRSCLSAASSFLLVIKSLAGQGLSVVEKNNIKYLQLRNKHTIEKWNLNSLPKQQSMTNQ